VAGRSIKSLKEKESGGELRWERNNSFEHRSLSFFWHNFWLDGACKVGWRRRNGGSGIIDQGIQPPKIFLNGGQHHAYRRLKSYQVLTQKAAQ
jgi:hypothetical protein